MYTFTIETTLDNVLNKDGNCSNLTIDVDVYANEDECFADNFSIWDNDNYKEIDYDLLSQDDKNKLDKLIDEKCMDNWQDALQSSRELEADRLYEQYKDGMYES